MAISSHDGWQDKDIDALVYITDVRVPFIRVNPSGVTLCIVVVLLLL